MANVPLMSGSGVATGTVELADTIFGLTPNVACMHQVVVAQLAHRRSGTQSTKTRADVRGGGRKPFKQKGTGNARQGSTRAPHWVGGGVALGPKPRKYYQKTPKKMIALALRSALSDRAASDKVIVVDSWNFDTPSTKQASALLTKLGTSGRVLIVVNSHDEAVAKSYRNLHNVQVIERGELNTYDVLCNDYVVFSNETLPSGEGVARKERTVVAMPAIRVSKPKPAESAPVEVARADTHLEATVTRRVTVRTIVDGVEHVEVREETVETVDADSIPDYNPDTLDTTVVRRERTVVDGEITSQSETITTEDGEA